MYRLLEVKPIEKGAGVEADGLCASALVEQQLEVPDITPDLIKVEMQLGSALDDLRAQLPSEDEDRLLEQVAGALLVTFRPEIGQEPLPGEAPGCPIGPGERAGPGAGAVRRYPPRGRRSAPARQPPRSFRSSMWDQ